jgi:hypothetical protein
MCIAFNAVGVIVEGGEAHAAAMLLLLRVVAASLHHP